MKVSAYYEQEMSLSMSDRAITFLLLDHDHVTTIYALKVSFRK